MPSLPVKFCFARAEADPVACAKHHTLIFSQPPNIFLVFRVESTCVRANVSKGGLASNQAGSRYIEVGKQSLNNRVRLGVRTKSQKDLHFRRRRPHFCCTLATYVLLPIGRDLPLNSAVTFRSCSHPSVDDGDFRVCKRRGTVSQHLR